MSLFNKPQAIEAYDTFYNVGHKDFVFIQSSFITLTLSVWGG